MADREQRILGVSALGPTATLDSPPVHECLGAGLAELVRPYRPGVVAYWNSPDAAVLAHVVARTLGVDVLAAYEDLGRLIVSRTPAPDTVAVLVGWDWDDSPGPQALVRTLTGAGCAVAAAATVLRDPRNAGLGVAVHTLEPDAGTS